MNKKSAAAPLTLPPIPRKGEALPAVRSIETAPEDPVEQPRQAAPRARPAQAERSTRPMAAPSDPPLGLFPSASRVRATIAVTVRLDEERYERLKSYSTGNRVTNQDIIVVALDRFFGVVE